jgi:probable phosphoglycerate mutase
VELLLIRHAQPVRVERTDGLAADPPLTELGHAQAKAMAAWLSEERVDAVYVSPLLRARQTAEPLAALFGLEPVVVEELAEYDRHEPHYIPLEDLRAMRTEGDTQRWQELLAGNDSDERRRWRDELVPAFEAIIDANRGKVVAAVCHGGVINGYISHVLGMERPMVFEPYYTAINRVLAAGSGQRSLMTVNESPWMRSLPKPVATAS